MCIRDRRQELHFSVQEAFQTMGNVCDGKGKNESVKYEGALPEDMQIRDFAKFKWIRHIAEGSNSTIAEYEKEGHRTIVKIVNFHDKEEHEHCRKLAYYMSLLEYFRTTQLKGYLFKYRANTSTECTGYLALNMDPVESVLSGVIANRMLTEKPFKREEIANIMRECLDGVKYLHGLGITHRAIKPSKFLVRGSNVKDSSHMDWVASPPTLKLCGLYHDVPRAHNKQDIAYVAPELRGGGSHDDEDGVKPGVKGEVDYRQADIYALGVVFLACLTLQDLRGQPLDQERIDHLVSLRSKDCADEIEIVKTMLNANPANRETADSLHEQVLKLYWKKGGAPPGEDEEGGEHPSNGAKVAPPTAGKTPGPQGGRDNTPGHTPIQRSPMLPPGSKAAAGPGPGPAPAPVAAGGPRPMARDHDD
eukprot:TRINITY_DN11077_c0_g1_i1.p1 TRINITY_DN11077_c0_g1~~TRINITY_DN11077_c0_g1_i1.p1  ORF type:complete len:419 (-),score=85.03 TRINITY_DN11077_c0_g1_i1:323-1579(-)